MLATAALQIALGVSALAPAPARGTGAALPAIHTAAPVPPARLRPPSRRPNLVLLRWRVARASPSSSRHARSLAVPPAVCSVDVRRDHASADAVLPATVASPFVPATASRAPPAAPRD